MKKLNEFLRSAGCLMFKVVNYIAAFAWVIAVCCVDSESLVPTIIVAVCTLYFGVIVLIGSYTQCKAEPENKKRRQSDGNQTSGKPNINISSISKNPRKVK